MPNRKNKSGSGGLGRGFSRDVYLNFFKLTAAQSVTLTGKVIPLPPSRVVYPQSCTVDLASSGNSAVVQVQIYDDNSQAVCESVPLVVPCNSRRVTSLRWPKNRVTIPDNWDRNNTLVKITSICLDKNAIASLVVGTIKTQFLVAPTELANTCSVLSGVDLFPPNARGDTGITEASPIGDALTGFRATCEITPAIRHPCRGYNTEQDGTESNRPSGSSGVKPATFASLGSRRAPADVKSPKCLCDCHRSSISSIEDLAGIESSAFPSKEADQGDSA